MWNNNSAGAAGYDQGGGYLNSPNVGGSQQQSKQPRQQRAQSIMSCTVAMISKAEQVEDKFTIDGIELNQVVLLGIVRSANETATRLDYTVDDMTGSPLEVRQFVDNDDTSVSNGSKLSSNSEVSMVTSNSLDIGLNPQQQQVLNAIRSCMDEQGISISIVSSRLKSISLAAIRDAVDFLSSEGHIYSTVDDEHYKATDSC